MPDVLVRGLSDSDKAFAERYAAARKVPQSDVLREALAKGLDQLRRSEPLDRDELRVVAEDLRALADPYFEDDAWS